MNKLYLLIISQMIISSLAFTQVGDTLLVQTYTFEEQNNPDADYDSPGRRWFQMPEEDGTEYQKILMYYTLKCFEDGTAGGLGFDCGEWDYTSHTFLYEHTGDLDSTALDHPRYLVNNQEYADAIYSNIPLTNTYIYEYEEAGIDVIEAEEAFSFSGETAIFPGFSQGEAGRIQFFLSEEYLNSVGLTAGDFQKLALNFTESVTLTNLELGIAALNMAPESAYSGDLTPIYFSAQYNANSGTNPSQFVLNPSFNWDGISGLLIDVSFDDCSDAFSLEGDLNGASMMKNGIDRYISFNGLDEVMVPAEVLSTLNDEVTVCFWMNGTEEFQPESGTTFEGVNGESQRVLNSHTPWENGRVYWDAGNSNGNYDRIDKQATNSDYEGQWNHWAFTKNTTSGEMKIYLNGILWHSGQDKANSLEGIEKFRIGAAAGWDNYYRGSMDDFYLFDVELTETQIQAFMSNPFSEELLASENLLVGYDFNDENGESLTDLAASSEGLIFGDASIENYDNVELVKGWSTISGTPKLTFYRGEYQFVYNTIAYETVEYLPAISLIEYGVDDHAVTVVNSSALYEIGYSYTYDTLGIAVDSVLNTPENPVIIENETLNYFSEPFEVVNRLELGRFITPYGIGLDLEEGWTWVYDVTDYEPLLHGQVELEAGNWQELLELKFAYIEGTPPRDVKRVENIWAGNWQLSTWDEQVQEQTIQVNEGEEMFKVRATTSGHWFGQGNNCAEFCSNVHDLKVNGIAEYSWEMMQECADNPLYPQGGTWVYDRAGWCPGAPVTTRELEVTPYVNGDEFSLEYDIDVDPYGNYWLMGQLISYGEMNYSNEVEISEILAPSDFKLNSRINPICADPLIRIRNNGSEVLTSCEFNFGINGQMETYAWTGSLAPLAYEDVSLSYGATEEIYNGDDEEVLTFEVSVATPNGVQDENDSNNYSKSNFVRPPTYGYDEDEDNNQIIVEIRTNASPQETTVYLKNLNGSIHWTGNYTEVNTLYRDTLTLNAGCYQLHVLDSGDDGLDFFANNDGTGYVRLKEVGGWYFETFESNFGKELKHNFNFETDIYDNVSELKVPNFNVYPNPSEAVFYVQGTDLNGRVGVDVFDNQGRLVKNISKNIHSAADRIAIDLKEYPSGLYQVVLKHEEDTYSKRIVKK